jgi:hypothetical protein
MPLTLKLEAIIDAYKDSKATVDIDAVKENPFWWLMAPRNDKSISIGKLKKYFNSSLFRGNKFGFPKEISENFLDFLVYRGSLSLAVKVELHWRLLQVAGAIWENDGLGNVFRLLEQAKLPEWQNGKRALEQFTPEQRASIKKNDANKMLAILLYEFADGRQPEKTDFIESDAFTKELNKDGLLLQEVIGNFYSKMTEAKKTDEVQFLKPYNNEFSTEFNFSPDHTGSIKESWDKHIQAWKNNSIAFIVGGMRATITKEGNYFRVYFINYMGLKSLALHITDDIIRPGPLRTTTQTFTFILTLEQFKKYKK